MAGTLTRTPPTQTSKNAELLARLRALEAIPVYSMTTMASIVTDKCIGLSRAILDRGNKKNKLHTKTEYTDEKVLRLCETIYANSYKYYDKLTDFMYSLNNRMNFVGNTDAYEGMSLSTEKALEIIDPHLENIGKAIEKELLKVCAPVDKPLCLYVLKLMFFSQLFVNYRSTFKDLAEIDTFRSLKVHTQILSLANALELKNVNGKTIRFLYTKEERELWEKIKTRRMYKGIKVAEQLLVDVKGVFTSYNVDKTAFDCIKALFRYKNIDLIIAAGDEGKSPRFSEMFSAPYYFGSMECYEQFSFTTSMLKMDYHSARVFLNDLYKIYPDGEFVFGLKMNGGRATFKGIWPSLKDAADENMISVDTVRSCAETNLTIEGKTQIRMDLNNVAYFWIGVMEELLNSKLKKDGN